MARYNLGTGMGGTPQVMTTTYKTLLTITAAAGATTLRRAWIYDVMVGPDGTPADNICVHKVDRQTANLGTATTLTPHPLDLADAASLMTCRGNHTVEPSTITDNSELIETPANQRTSYRWVASQGGELIVPATDLAGIGLRSKSAAYTGTMVANMHFRE